MFSDAGRVLALVSRAVWQAAGSFQKLLEAAYREGPCAATMAAAEGAVRRREVNCQGTSWKKLWKQTVLE